jgi:hypothetical protein
VGALNSLSKGEFKTLIELRKGAVLKEQSASKLKKRHKPTPEMQKTTPLQSKTKPLRL